MADVGVPEILMILVVLAFFGLPIWAVIDAAMRPSTQFEASHQSKPLWIILPIVTFWIPFLGMIVSIVYLAAIRPKLIAAIVA